VVAVPIKVLNESALPVYDGAAALCGLLARRGRCELIPATARHVSEWSPHRFGKAGAPLPDWWDDDPILDGRAVELFRVSYAYYLPASGAVISAAGEAMESSIEEARSAAPEGSLAGLACIQSKDGVDTFEPPRAPPQLQQAVVTMPLGAMLNYGHFVLDCLAGVVATMKVRELRSSPYVFPALAPWQRRHLELLGVMNPFVTTGSIYRVSRLYFTNAMAHNLHSPNVHHLALRDMQLTNVRPEAPAGVGERIYLSRRGAQQRSFVNDAEVEARLASLGFSIVQPQAYDVDEQIQMFRQAKVIVGPAGAAFTNVLYCRPDTLIVEIVPTPMAARWVGWLCAMTGSRWRPYYCKGRSERTWGVQIDLRFSVDADDLIHHIVAEIGR
jgi:capsular polysaccharide biosynthesis protein